MSQVTPFAIIHPTDREDDDCFLIIPTKIWKNSLDPLYPSLGCDYVVRTQIAWGEDNDFRYMWVDEDARLRIKPINSKATALLKKKRGGDDWIAGIVAIEGKAYDPDKVSNPADFVRTQFENLNYLYAHRKQQADFPPIQNYKEPSNEQR